jgi:hypothetical protein
MAPSQSRPAEVRLAVMLSTSSWAAVAAAVLLTAVEVVLEVSAQAPDLPCLQPHRLIRSPLGPGVMEELT